MGGHAVCERKWDKWEFFRWKKWTGNFRQRESLEKRQNGENMKPPNPRQLIPMKLEQLALDTEGRRCWRETEDLSWALMP